MTDLAATIAAVHAAIQTLADADHIKVAEALSRWLVSSSESFDSALELPTDWRQRLRVAARDRALVELSRLHGDEDCSRLADRIAAGLLRARPGARRRDGSLGFIDDLAAAGCSLGARQLRRLIADIRRGHQGKCNGHGSVAA